MEDNRNPMDSIRHFICEVLDNPGENEELIPYAAELASAYMGMSEYRFSGDQARFGGYPTFDKCPTLQ